jgi:hypothetical protein
MYSNSNHGCQSHQGYLIYAVVNYISLIFLVIHFVFFTGLFLDGYKLRVNIAVTRGKAEQLKTQTKESKKEPRDKRNVYLAREGVITPGSEAAKDLSKADLQRRQKAEADRRNAKRKAIDKNEEKEFNSVVQKYKSKLFGESGSNAKRSRWFE